ncbi:uncharacterized protein DUF3987 [Litoreibacter ponti]|uniref:Uncharacterized protein DUF3987 n=1 Tax=Litoreibacter ponti TaxID=1510457 RepID=A0A2T6BF17_9RHOB|nr:DUF3987 domain-containing protein [Litoreibacter ponti]PTX54658.1 uncharacterized protein DUF3987 [Litoreibacter ponti]
MPTLIPLPFTPNWPDPDPRFLNEEQASPPVLVVHDFLTPRLANLLISAADAKAAPVDYVFVGLLVTASSLIGNSRWASPWVGWKEPPVLWAALIGKPSMNKSPGLDAVLEPLKHVEANLRVTAKKKIAEWDQKAEIAKVVEFAWKEGAKEAAKSNKPIKPKPEGADPGPKPDLPRLALSDATIEKLASILQFQPKGTLLLRDELAGWLTGMTRYSGGGTDRPFWLEGYGGRPYTVERVGRPPVNVEHLAIAVIGNIQPDRLNTLFMRSDDDGLLARIIPVWPNPAPVSRPKHVHDDRDLCSIFERLISLEMETDDVGLPRPAIVGFTEEAKNVVDEFRQKVRDWEAEVDGLLLSFIGKLPGLTIRLSLVMMMLEWACGSHDEPREISAEAYRKATILAENYFLQMAKRTYGSTSVSQKERAGRRLVELLRKKAWKQFSSREVRRAQRTGLATQEEIDMGIAALERADIIKAIKPEPSPKGGRPQRLFAVNPVIHLIE